MAGAKVVRYFLESGAGVSDKGKRGSEDKHGDGERNGAINESGRKKRPIVNNIEHFHGDSLLWRTLETKRRSTFAAGGEKSRCGKAKAGFEKAHLRS